MNLADPELELIDPTPNVHTLFVHFDKEFFWTKLASRAAVRWSKRMYSCAGICSYDRGGLCDIALSEPLLKLRPRKDLIETLLHEMIHAFLFVNNKDQDRDGHGPNFKAHMNRINQSAGLNISIYHDFHDEVELYRTHWWRCNGPCQTRKPHFGIVRKTANRPPAPSDNWWNYHMRKCGGTFVKIKEPEKKGNKKVVAKPLGDITKFVTQNNQVPGSNYNIKTISTVTKKNNNNTILVTPKTKLPSIKPFVSPQENNKTINVFGGKGQTLSPKIENSVKSVSVAEAVRNVWANKTFSGVATSSPLPVKRNNSVLNTNTSPPLKIKKIDDYFKAATSVLKDVYGQDFDLTTSDKDKKIIVVNNTANETKPNLVDCPICKSKVKDEEINSHLDECLNKEVIEELNSPKTSQDRESNTSEINNSNSILNAQKCACCNETIDKPLDQHLDECLAFFDNNTTMPTEGTSAHIETIVIEDDEDIMNESQIMNDTGTKYPCPCCLKMIEEAEMNDHLDVCLG